MQSFGYICGYYSKLDIYKPVIPGKKKKIKRRGIWVNLFCGANFIISNYKGVLKKNKVETLAIYINLLSQCIWRDFWERRLPKGLK